jgi:hypothetical protein
VTITATKSKLPITKLNRLIAENIRGLLSKPNEIIAKYVNANTAPIVLFPVKLSNALLIDANKYTQVNMQ